ncbi:MAG: hypothetical protein GY749_45310 [Desulfobacteraceae bacterium]|nr:hypothetical protein [Desulfobacteraceae bacterium]
MCSTTDLLKELTDNQFPVVSKKLERENKKLLIIIDGLDESLSTEGDMSAGKSLLNYIPKNTPANLFILMAGRPREETDEIFYTFNREKTRREILKGLPDKNITELFYYGTGRSETSEEYVNRVLEISEGNPLFIKCLINELNQGKLSVNDAGAIPGNLQEMYAGTVRRIVGTNPRTADILITLALAREQLSPGQIADINKAGLTQTLDVIDHCLEVLIKSYNAERDENYRIFHDSFSDYMRLYSRYKTIIPKISEKIVLYAVNIKSEQPSEDVLKAVDALINGKKLKADMAHDISFVITRASQMLSSWNIVKTGLLSQSIDETDDLYIVLARTPGTATARAVIDCLIAGPGNFPGKLQKSSISLLQKQNPVKSRKFGKDIWRVV